MRAILIAVMLCVGMACAGESVDERVAAVLEKEIAGCKKAIAIGEASLRKMELEGKKPFRGMIEQQEQARKTLAEKQAALAKVRPTLTPDQEVAKAEAEVKAAEEALAKAKDRLKKAKDKQRRGDE